ncbi:hypothetical protein [Photobacterium damselae]|uniref:hypothetical protein n=1 Tax=Photobacterium damselae TaxID=38293 RepID=UPI004068113C
MKQILLLLFAFIAFPSSAKISWEGYSPSKLKHCKNRFDPEPECTPEMSDIYGDMIIEFNNCQITQFLKSNPNWESPKLSDCSDVYPSDEDLQKIDPSEISGINISTKEGRDKLWSLFLNKDSVKPDDFWGDTVKPEDKNEEYKAEIEILQGNWQGAISKSGKLSSQKKDIIKKFTNGSIFTIRSLSDLLPITSVIVNRGNCKAYPLTDYMTNSIYGNMSVGVGLPNFPSQIDLKFGEKSSILTNCQNEDIREVIIKTPNGDLTVAINN